MLCDVHSWSNANSHLKALKELPTHEQVVVYVRNLIKAYMGLNQHRLNFMWDKRYYNEIGMYPDYIKVYTDYIKVYPDYRGNGLAEMLYYRAALWANSMGKRYRFSNTQSESARKVMQRFIDRDMVSTERRRMWNRVQEFKFLETEKPLWVEG